MANFDFNTLTPGSAVAQTLQEILAQRRAEARQAMLDKLAAAENERQYGLDKDRLAQQKAYQDAQLKLNQTQEERAAAADKTRNTQWEFEHLPGQVDPAGVSPEMAEIGKKTGRFRQNLPSQQTAIMMSPNGPVAGPTQQQESALYDAGSPEYQEKQLEKSERNAALERAGITQQQRSLLEAGVNLPASTFEKPGVLRVFGANGALKGSYERGPNDAALELNYPPQGPAAYNDRYGSFRFRANPSAPWQSRYETSSEFAKFFKDFLQKNPNAQEDDSGAIPRDNAQDKSGVPATMWQALMNAGTKAGLKDEDRKAQQSYIRRGIAAYAAQTMNPTAANVLMQAGNLLDTNLLAGKKMDVEKVMANIVHNEPSLTPEEQARIRIIITGMMNPTMPEGVSFLDMLTQ